MSRSKEKFKVQNVLINAKVEGQIHQTQRGESI